MKNKKLYQHSINVLLRAYKNNMLENRLCTSCAVGHLVAEGCGYTFDFRYLSSMGDKHWQWENAKPWWKQVFMTEYPSGTQHMGLNKYVGIAKAQIDSTGYSVHELAQIEYAFEMNARKSIQNGLMAVIDVLDKIHEVPGVCENPEFRFKQLLSEVE